MLKIDNGFTPCPCNSGDELFPNGIFEFNITKILEEVAVRDFCKNFSSIDESHMDSVDISVPVILAEIYPGLYNVIDGNHRMEKASKMGVNSMPAYRLNVNQHIKI